MESLEPGQAGAGGHVAKHKGDAPGHAKGFGAAAQAFKRSAANERKRKKQRAPVGPPPQPAAISRLKPYCSSRCLAAGGSAYVPPAGSPLSVEIV